MNGGTKMYCPHCKDIAVCSAIPLSNVGESSGQRKYMSKYPDINLFQRARRCNTCSEEFLTAEVDDRFLEELIELRDALKDLKVNAEKYIVESHRASRSLRGLAKSLKVLKALKIYKKTTT
jgi:hypothetical protein